MTTASRKRRALVLAAFVVLAAAAVWFWWNGREPSGERQGRADDKSAVRTRSGEKPTLQRIASAAAAARRLVSKRLARAPRISDQERENELRKRMAQPTNIKRELNAGNEKWLATVLTFEDYFFAREERLECAHALSDEMAQGCLYNLDMAIERTSKTQGVVRLAGAQADGNDEPLCEVFAQCVAQGRVGQTVPLPEEDTETYGFRQRIFSPPLDPKLKDPSVLAEMIDSERIGLEELKSRMSPTSTKDKYMLLTNTMLLRYQEKQLEEVTSGH